MRCIISHSFNKYLVNICCVPDTWAHMVRTFIWNLKGQIHRSRESDGGYQEWGDRENWVAGMMVKGTKLQLRSMRKPRDLIYNMMDIVNNVVLNTGSLLRE